MKTNFRLFAVTLTLLSASLAGCFGGDDEDEGYSGPIDLVVYYESTSGMIESSRTTGQPDQITGVTLSFDFADTTSKDGNITKITLDPDDGSNVIEGNPDENAVLSYEWLTHGVFEINVGAEDAEGNSHEVEIVIRIDMRAEWTELNTNSASMSFDATPDCEDGQPLAESIVVISTVTNLEGTFWDPGENSDVTWKLQNPEEVEISSGDGTIADGGSETWEHSTEDVIEGFWTMDVEVTSGDSVNVENDVTILYPEGSEDSPNPRTE